LVGFRIFGLKWDRLIWDDLFGYEKTQSRLGASFALLFANAFIFPVSELGLP
jgi:hypothetical protein